MQPSLPPGPSAPRFVQTMGWWKRPVSYPERLRARYGKRFTMRLLGAPTFVVFSTPDEIREIFQTAPDVLHPGEGARILQPVVGSHSLILLDEAPHLEQRKLLLPAFRGHKMQELTALMEEVTERELASWPRDATVEIHPRLQGLTLEIMLRAVFGLDEGDRLDALRTTLTSILEFGARPESLLPFLQRDMGRFTAWHRFVELRKQADALIFELIDERRRSGEERDDVLAMLLAARHDDDSPMTPQELRDELMTMLVAGHETTASELAWMFERLTREPRVMAELMTEIDSDSGDDTYLTATVNETLRRRPVLPNAEPRLAMRDVEIGGRLYPKGVALIANGYLLHHDSDVYPQPYEFRPERFVDEAPGTYTWIPFGGGRRRCIGASFATLEMKIVMRAVLRAAEVRAGHDGPELTRRRSITLSPRLGAPMVLRDRVREPALV
jgi:cytochrome P450